MATYAEQLAEVRAAISKVLTSGQSYEISDGGMTRTVTRANLEWLNMREATLIPLAAQEESGRSGRRSRTMSTGF